MKSIRTGLILPLLLVLGMAATVAADSVLEDAAREAVGAGRLVTLVIEQEGNQMLAPDGGTVVLRRAPFTIWVIHGTDDGILLQVSGGSTVYDGVGPGSTLVQRLGVDAGQLMGLAEVVYNSERTLYLDTYSAHYLPNPRTSSDHRYNRLYYGTVESDFTVGGRDVEYLVDLTAEGKRRTVRVSAFRLREVFISAIVATRDANYMPYVVDYHTVRIEFLQ